MNYNPTLHKLSNGVTVILDPMELETVNVTVQFRTGSRDEMPHEYGITHFCEHMLCKGTSRFPTQKMANEYLEYKGGGKNAATGNRLLEFHGRIIAENVTDLIEVIGDQIQNSLFDPDKIEIERTVIMDELRRDMDNPMRQFIDFRSDKLFNRATFSIRNLGTMETIKSFTREQMLEFLARRLSAKNCIICISGKINDENSVLKCLEKTFGFLPPIDVTENDAITYSPTVAHNSQPDKKNVRLNILFPDVCNKWPRAYENRFKYRCVRKFECHMSHELSEIVRRQNGLVYGFGIDGIGNEKFSLTGFSTQTAPENLPTVVALIAKNAYKIYAEKTITDEDLIRFECSNKLGYADFLESAGRRCAKLINVLREYGRVYDFYDDIQIGNSIRRDDIIENTRGYFDGPMSILTQGADFDVDLASVWRENFK